ncbi:WD40-repeat-containing domain protein [Pilobolus umbonatus]|nr:WD40-repeat-containing domain protein [Pilobolus umbonatus]
MGKQSFKPNPETSTVETSSNATVNSGIEICSFDESTTAEYFALISHAMDRHRLRIFNVRSGTVMNDYSSHEKYTSLTWGYMKDTGELQASTVQAFKKKKTGNSLTRIIALGTQTGSIYLYSLSHGDIVKKLSFAHTTPIVDFVMKKDGSRGYSVAEDSYIVEWNIEEGKEIRQWKADTKNVKKLKLSHDETKLATAGHTITLWDLNTYEIIKKFTGHASPIKELSFSAQDDLLISSAIDDRYVNVWDSQSTNTNSNNLTALTLESNVIHVDFSHKEPSVLAVTEDGIVGIWENASSTNQGHIHSRRKMIRSLTKEADSKIRIVSNEATPIPIISAAFVIDNNSKSIMIARGSSIKPSFEVISFVDEETGNIVSDIELTRQPITNYLIDTASIAANNLKTTRKAYNESTVTVVGTTDYSMIQPTLEMSEPSIEQKLQELDVDSSPLKGKSENKKLVPIPSASSLQVVLVQALHAKDKALLEACLQHHKLDIVQNTVKRLPTEYLIPLLLELITKFQEKPARAPELLVWIQTVLLTHTAYLMTVPDLIGKLSNFYQALDNRLNVFPKLLALKGRLDIVQSQVDVRSYSTLNEKELEEAQIAKNVYNEMDSDDEAEAEDLLSIHDEIMESDQVSTHESLFP